MLQSIWSGRNSVKHSLVFHCNDYKIDHWQGPLNSPGLDCLMLLTASTQSGLSHRMPLICVRYIALYNFFWLIDRLIDWLPCLLGRVLVGRRTITCCGTTIILPPTTFRCWRTNCAIRTFGVPAVCQYRPQRTTLTLLHSGLATTSLRKNTTGQRDHWLNC